MKFIALIAILFSYFHSKAQNLQIDTSSKNKKPEIFSSGFIDVMNTGQVNASARFIKLYIGEPGKLSIPISFYCGVSNNTFQASSPTKSNEQLVSQYINPMSGLVNISLDQTVYFKKTEKLTKTAFICQLGERLLNGTRIGQIPDPLTGKPVNFLNTLATGGFLFQTGAWEKTNSKNVGIFWLTTRYHFCKSSPKSIKEFLPDIETKGIYTGYSIGFGIEINMVVDIKAIYYKYLKAPEIDYGLPIYQFSFNYQMQK